MCGAAKFFVSIIILPAFLTPCFAQQAPNSPASTGSVVVNVLDAHGNAVRDLTKENFRFRLNGKPVTVLDARYSLAPRRIVVLLDVSGSMTGETGSGKWQIVREAVEDLLTQTPSDVSIAMLTFAGGVRDVFDFLDGKKAITKWLSEGPSQRPDLRYPATRTALFDAILEGLKLFGPIQTGDALYAITDGGEDASQATQVQTKSALLHSGVRLFAFLFDKPLPVPDEPFLTVTQEQEARESFRKMVDDSGGFVFSVAGFEIRHLASWNVDYIYDNDNREKVKLYTKELNIQVSGFWTLENAVPASNEESRMNVEIVGHEGRIRKDVRVTYSRMLSAAK